MNKLTASTAIPTRALKLEALSNISASFELFCLASGMEALGEMMDHDAQAICGPRHAGGHERQAHRWGKTKGKIGFHGGKVEIERPRLRGFAASQCSTKSGTSPQEVRLCISSDPAYPLDAYTHQG